LHPFFNFSKKIFEEQRRANGRKDGDAHKQIENTLDTLQKKWRVKKSLLFSFSSQPPCTYISSTEITLLPELKKTSFETGRL
jgi:hypothetical protein